ncbi:GntR family transcriptional regulator [Nakamurella endophytica]|uniref:GntR family transcriptional regulator n=1 Tax=Nakamurella endophytica TaxID=1748367 RepID=UPI001E2A2B8D|nr:GntR family transcriptional regulator [Nakamurella endophytica]
MRSPAPSIATAVGTADPSSGPGTEPAAAALLTASPEPLWIQASNVIRSEIDKGALQPGTRLPPERELCAQLNISRVTLRKALAKLVEEGALSATHGRGWYISGAGTATEREWPHTLESFTETARRMRLVPHSRVLRAAAQPASLDEAELLSIAPGTPLFHLDRVRLLDDVPIAIDISAVPLAMAPDLPAVDFETASLYQVLLDAGLNLVRADSTIESREVDPVDAPYLDLDVGKPILLLHQVVLDESGRPVLSSLVKYSGARYRLRTSFTRQPRFDRTAP